MKSDKLIKYIENIATEALLSEYWADDTYILIDRININFDIMTSYTVTIKCCAKSVISVFDIETVLGLPRNIFDFNNTEAYAFAIYVANIASKIHKASTNQKDDFNILVDDDKITIC